MNNSRVIEVSVERINKSGKAKPFSEIMADLKEQMMWELARRGFSDSANHILVSAKDIPKYGKMPFKLTYKVVDSKKEAEELEDGE